MKKVFTILGCLIALMFLALPTTASNLNETLQNQSHHALTFSLDLKGGAAAAASLDAKTVKEILELAALQLPYTYAELLEAYHRGFITIEKMGTDMYKVYDGGGNIAIVVLDSL